MEKRICYEPCLYREHMYQRVYCTQNKIGRMKKKNEIYGLLLLYQRNTKLTKDVCFEIAKYF